MKKIINTDLAPAAIGPYEQAISFADLVFTSGQIPLDPKTMEIKGANIHDQAHQALSNLKAVLEAGNSSLEQVIKTTCFLKDMGDFQVFNEVYASYFDQSSPARSCVEVARLPKDVLVEVEAIAIKHS